MIQAQVAADRDREQKRRSRGDLTGRWRRLLHPSSSEAPDSSRSLTPVTSRPPPRTDSSPSLMALPDLSESLDHLESWSAEHADEAGTVKFERSPEGRDKPAA